MIDFFDVNGVTLAVWFDADFGEWVVGHASRAHHGFVLSSGATRAEALRRLDRSAIVDDRPPASVPASPEEVEAIDARKWRALVDDLLVDVAAARGDRDLIHTIDEPETIADRVRAAVGAHARRYRESKVRS